MNRKKCVVLGASGLIGQQFLRMLANHPYLEIVGAYSSAKNAGKTMKQVWELPFYTIPSNIAELKLKELNEENLKKEDFDIAFSGLPAGIANSLEISLRRDGKYVFTNSSPHRMDEDVPILIPEINQEHVELAKIQTENHEGFIVANANCSVTGASMYLGEIAKLLTIDKVVISTYQALSGAGIAGVSSVRIADNVIPYIQNEEEKIEIEAQKILGDFKDNMIVPKSFDVIANSARVNVIDGHTEAITVFSETIRDEKYIIDALSSIRSPLMHFDLPSAPEKHIQYMYESDRPQPRIDRFLGDGMTASVGRIRVRKDSVSSYILVHNTIRGGAGGSVLNAELALKLGLIK